MKEDDLHNMKLPSRNEKEELEDISRNLFRQLFDVTLFEFIQEIGRDKGIDFNIELKKGKSHTGIRFLVQLKATGTIKKNVDGSISCPIDTSNINALLNSGLISYYVFYHKPSNTFYFESLSEILRKLSTEKEKWSEQDSHSIRFSKVFDNDARKLLYDEVMKRGIMLRSINEKLAIESSLLDVGNTILVDQNLNVSSDEEVRTIIEKFGLQLINEARWNDVLNLHQKVSQTVASTALYNLTLGMANYYSGDLLSSLKFLKSALLLKDQLTESLAHHLAFFDIIVRYALGLLTADQYKEKRKDLEGKGDVGDQIRIDAAKERYFKSTEADIDVRYEIFLKEMDSILQDPNIHDQVKLMAKCDLILIEGAKIDTDFLRSIPRIKIAEMMSIDTVRKAEIEHYLRNKEQWMIRVMRLKNEIINSKNYFAYYHVIVNEIKVLYEFIVYRQILHPADNRAAVEDLLNNLEGALLYFRKISFTQNICTALSIKYELLHYNENFEKANAVLRELSDLIHTYELNDSKIKLEVLRNEGALHQRFESFLKDMTAQATADDIEYEKLVNEIREMDRNDSNNFIRIKSPYVITLYPLGEFQFPADKRKTVYEILRLPAEVESIFDNMWDVQEVIPVANIYYEKIEMEGYRELSYDTKIEVWRNMHRIRAAFYENRFSRVRLMT